MDVFSYLLGKESSGGGGSSHDWEAIGFASEPKSISDGYNYAKTIQSEYNDNKTYGGNSNLVYFPYVDTSKRITFSGMFYMCSSLEEIALIDFSNSFNIYNMCYSCRALKSIPQFNTSKVEIWTSAFNDCKSLKDVPVLDTSKADSFNFVFNDCTSLSNDSLNNILRMCINATRVTTNKTLQTVGLSSTQARTCQSLSNYQDFLDAGWTTGY